MMTIITLLISSYLLGGSIFVHILTGAVTSLDENKLPFKTKCSFVFNSHLYFFGIMLLWLVALIDCAFRMYIWEKIEDKVVKRIFKNEKTVSRRV